jgi:hypothetical protein
MDKARRQAGRKSRPTTGDKRGAAPTTARMKTGPNVKWVEVDHIKAVLGHGVEFWHVTQPDTVLAFIVGCDFMQRANATATVELVRADRAELAPPQRAMLRRKVLSVVRRRGRCRWPGTGQIQAVVNG